MPPNPNPRIDRKLNLVLPVDGTQRGTIYVHSTPLSLDLFEQYVEVISVAYSTMLDHLGRGMVSTGPRVARMYLRKAAERLGQLDDVDRGLFATIEQQTNILAKEDGRGWIASPYYDAKKWMDDEDRSAVDNAVAFFIVCSAAMPRQALPGALAWMTSVLGAENTSSDCTAYCNSLPTSTPAEPTTAGA